MNILVTGSAGAVGFEVSKQLLEEGHHVLAFDLPQYEYMFEEFDSVTYFPYNLNQSVFKIQPGLSHIRDHVNVGGVINCAAIVDISKSFDDIKLLNIDLVHILRKTFERQPFVHLSSGSIYENRINKKNGMIEEKDIIKDHRDKNVGDYERSKAYADGMLLLNFPCSFTTILRPALIYGPRAGFLGAALAGIGPMIKTFSNSSIGFTGGPKTNWVHCEDVARACVWALERESVRRFEIFNICDDVAYPFGDIITTYMEVYGLNIDHKVNIPSPKTMRKFKWLLNNKVLPNLCDIPVKFLWSMIKNYHELEGRLHMSVDKGMIDYLFNDTIFSNEKIKEAGFELKYPDSRKEIKNTLDWYKINNWIPR